MTESNKSARAEFDQALHAAKMAAHPEEMMKDLDPPSWLCKIGLHSFPTWVVGFHIAESFPCSRRGCLARQSRTKYGHRGYY